MKINFLNITKFYTSLLNNKTRNFEFIFYKKKGRLRGAVGSESETASTLPKQRMSYQLTDGIRKSIRIRETM